MSENLIKFKWWWSWNSDDFESYLENMAQNGWLLKSAGFGLIYLSFEKSQPQNVRYCLDYNSKYTEEYTQIVSDDGWKLLGKSSGWILWSKAYTDTRPNLFTDKTSLIDRNKRLLSFSAIILATQIPIGIINFNSLFNGSESHSGPFRWIVLGLYLFIITTFIYAIFKMLMENKNLKE